MLLAAVKASVDAAASTSKPNHREAAARIYAYVTEAGLDAVWDASPPFDGEALREVLPGIPHGPPFRRVMDTQVGRLAGEGGGEERGCVGVATTGLSALPSPRPSVAHSCA